MSMTADGISPAGSGPADPPPLQHRGGAMDDHGRLPGAPSRTGTGSTGSPSDPERVGEANARPAEPAEPRQRYELAFPGGSDGGQDLVEVTRISRTGPGGHPVYEDATGIVQAEISDQAEVRILATGGQQESTRGVVARPLA